MNSSKAGSRTAYVLKHQFVAASDSKGKRAVETCGKTYVVAAATVSGIRIPEDGYERVIDGFDPKQMTAAFALEDRDDVHFSNDFESETIDTKTFARRMQNEAWCLANPNHPISYMYWALRSYTEMVKAIRDQKPMILFQRGISKAFCVVGGDPERNRFILDKAGFSSAEIDEILSKLPAFPAAKVSFAPRKPAVIPEGFEPFIEGGMVKAKSPDGLVYFLSEDGTLEPLPETEEALAEVEELAAEGPR